MTWQKIKYLAQIEAIQKDTLLLRYPSHLSTPDELRNENIGNIYSVTNITNFGAGIRYSIRHHNPQTPQQIFENTYDGAVDSNELLNSVWFVVSV